MQIFEREWNGSTLEWSSESETANKQSHDEDDVDEMPGYDTE